MSEAPSMPMYWDAYIADTTHLSTEEHGAYMLLLAAMWRRNGYVPDDDTDTARILGLSKAKWRKAKARFKSPPINLIVENGTVTQKKLLKTWRKTREKIEKNRANGSLGGRPKRDHEHNDPNHLGKANGYDAVNPIETIPEPEPEPDIKKVDTNVSLANKDYSKDAVDIYNGVAGSNAWPLVERITKPRVSQVNARIREAGGIEGWRVAIEKATASDFLCSRSHKPFSATFDWLVKAANFTKLMEGNYDNRQPTNGASSAQLAKRADDAGAIAIARLRAQR